MAKGWSDTISPKQMQRLEAGLGCVQCGRAAVMQAHGYLCCGRPACRRELKIIRESYIYADAIRQQQRNSR